MRTSLLRIAVCAAGIAAVLLPLTALPAVAQTPACPCPPAEHKGPWTGSAGFGLALNRGNTDTTNVNLTFDAVRDPKHKDVWKFQALYLRGDTAGTRTVDQLFGQGRYEHSLSPRAFAFGQVQYLRDEFKQIDYLIAPTGGLGYKLVNTPAVVFAVDGGAGLKWKKNPGFDVDTSATISAGDRLDWKLSPTATARQGFSALWDADDFGDALYAFSAGLASSVVQHIELKVELLDTYASKPPLPTVKKNDIGILTALVYRF